MKKILLFVLFIVPVNLLAQDTVSLTDGTAVKTVKSPPHRVAILELYTSEGCSSCPPADRFLSNLKANAISDRKLIAMAFHVTYWDYIGWKDRFAKKQYDQRQRDLAHKSRKSTVYTPQFLLVGEDYRKHASFNEDINKLLAQTATVDLELSANMELDQNAFKSAQDEKLYLTLNTDISRSDVKDVGVYFAVLENNLFSEVDNGENDADQSPINYENSLKKVSGMT